MLFNSCGFLLFFPVVVVIYYAIPPKMKQVWLLLSNYFFYMCWNLKYGLLLGFCTVISFLGGRYIDKYRGKQNLQKILLICIACVIFGVLLYYKYLNYLIIIVSNSIYAMGFNIHAHTLDILLPVGISFFTFQSMGYVIDVYRGKIQAENNFVTYAVFLSFFPQLVAGPIEQYSKLGYQLKQIHFFDFNKAREGLLLMLWGYFLKLVIADRIAIYVDNVFADIYTYDGYYLIVATILFGIQIYCDFAGYSIIAIGAAQIMGIHLSDNFNAPYLSETVAEFWRNWHMTLMHWFREYVYYPLGGNRKGKRRAEINKLVVFLISGLWHGANISYALWGGLNAIYILIGEKKEPFREKVYAFLRLNKNGVGAKIARILITFCLIDFSWIFFRAETTTQALRIVKHIIFANNPWVLFDGSLFRCGLDAKNFVLLVASILLVFAVDLCTRNGILVRKVICRQDYLFRWIIISLSVVFIAVFGVWGTNFDSTGFIYFQF